MASCGPVDAERNDEISSRPRLQALSQKSRDMPRQGTGFLTPIRNSAALTSHFFAQYSIS
jgi:hypothetical protein